MDIHELPKEIENTATEIGKVTDELATLREQIRDAELMAAAGVLEVRDTDNRLLYPNDRAREIAIHRILTASHTYTQDKASERILERRKAELSAQLERLRREYSIALIDYEAQQLGRRHAA